MEPWIQPTTAPRQPDAADDDKSVEEQVRVERGWMEDPQAESEAWDAPIEARSESIAITVFTVVVVLGFLVLVIAAFPFLLLGN